MLFDGIEILEGSEVINFSFPMGASFPSSPNQGEIFFKTDVKKPYIYVDSAWVEMSTTSSGAGANSNGVVSIAMSMSGVVGVEGELVYSIADSKLFVHNGTAFVESFTQSKPVTIVPTLVGLSGSNGELVFNSTDGIMYVNSSGNWVATQEKIYDIAITAPGDVSAASTIVFFVAPRAFTIPQTFVGSHAVIGTSVGDVTYTLYKNGIVFGTVAFLSSATVGTFTASAGDVVFAAGDVLSIDSPADNAPTNLAITFKAII